MNEDLTAGEKNVGVARLVGAWCGGVWPGWPRRGMFDPREGDHTPMWHGSGPMIRTPIDGLFEDPRKKTGVARLVLEMDDGVGACFLTLPDACV